MSSNPNINLTSKPEKLPPLFCKPIPLHYTGESLYVSREPSSGDNITFRSLEPDQDLDFLFDWVNRPYSRPFWQLSGSRSLLLDTCLAVLQNPHAHSFIGCRNGRPVCQVDLYQIAADELKDHISRDGDECGSGADDCGLHLLMCPPDQLTKGLSLVMLLHFIHFYFSFPQAEKLYAEPDKENVLANRLAEKAGFRFLKEVRLSYKTARLYRITKEEFQKTTHAIHTI